MAVVHTPLVEESVAPPERTLTFGERFNRWWLSVRIACGVLSTHKPYKVRSFVEWARDRKVERSIPPHLLADCLSTIYCAPTVSTGGSVRYCSRNDLRRMTHAVYVENDEYARRKIVSSLLKLGAGDVPLTLLEDMCAIGFKIQGKDHRNLVVHVTYAETQWRKTYSLLSSSEGAIVPYSSFVWQEHFPAFSLQRWLEKRR